MEAFFASLLEEVKKFLGPKFVPIMLGLTGLGLLLHPLGEWHELKSNQKALALDYTRLEQYQKQSDAKYEAYIEKDLKYKEALTKDVSRIQGYLKLHSKEE